MPIKDKKSLIIAILAILALAAAGYYLISLSPSSTTNPPSSGQKTLIEKSLLQEIGEESVITNQEDSDPDLISADDNEINDLGNSADENEL